MDMLRKKIAICVLAHNSSSTIRETLDSCLMQDYPNKEIAIMEDGSTDNTLEIAREYEKKFSNVKVYSIKENIGFSKNTERCFHLNAHYIVLMCSDDLFTHKAVVGDIVKEFANNPMLAHVSRYYYQFIDGDPAAVRANRSNSIYQLADNPSGLAFKRRISFYSEIYRRKVTFNPCGKVSQQYFIEAASLVYNVLCRRHSYSILKYDTVAVRVHKNASTTGQVYRTACIKAWWALTSDKKIIQSLFVSLVQVKKYGTYQQLFREIKDFIKIDALFLADPRFLFYCAVSILTPKRLLIPAVNFYKTKILKKTTRIIRRNETENNYISSVF